MPVSAASSAREILTGLHEIMAKRGSAQAKLDKVAGVRTEGQKLSICLIDNRLVPVGRTFSSAARARFAHAGNIGRPGPASAAGKGPSVNDA